jgi:hypothetical protein
VHSDRSLHHITHQTVRPEANIIRLRDAHLAFVHATTLSLFLLYLLMANFHALSAFSAHTITAAATAEENNKLEPACTKSSNNNRSSEVRSQGEQCAMPEDQEANNGAESTTKAAQPRAARSQASDKQS